MANGSPHNQTITLKISLNNYQLFITELKLSVELEVIKKSITPRGATFNEEDEQMEDQPEEGTEIRISIRTTRLERDLLKNLYLYSGLSPQNRPKIPRMKGLKKLLENVQKINSLIRNQISSTSSIQEIVDLVYAAAVTVCEEHGLKMRDS